MGGTSSKANLPVPFIYNWDAAAGDCVETPGDWVDWQKDLLSDCCTKQLLIPAIGRNGGLAVIWILLLAYIFMGVGFGAEVFMTAIEVVTSKEYTKNSGVDKEGKPVRVHVRVWNATVANLTLMALGSSAPEILLNVIEVLTGGFNAGELGPSTIVGSAAFNLMVITAVCIVCLKPGETRTLKQLGVFLTTAFYSVLAYIWLYIMVIVWTPEVITIAEAVITCLLLVLLIIQAFIIDKRATANAKRKYLGLEGTKGAPTKAEAAAALKAAKLGKDASPDEIKSCLEEELLPPKSRLHYRKQAMGKGMSQAKPQAGKVMPEAELEPVRAKTMPSEPTAPPGAADPSEPGIIKWVSYTYDVMESGGSLKVEAERVKGSKGEISCSYTTKNQKAVAGKDYGEMKGEFKWADGDSTTKHVIEIPIYDDDEFEKDEEFTVVLFDAKGAKFDGLTDGGQDEDITTVTIINDDDRATRLVEAIRMLKIDADSLDLATEDWKGALQEAIFPPADAGVFDKVMHFLMVPWKLMFALCPPAGLCGGWPCFFVSLGMIGFQVVLISDFANQVGCQMYIKTSVTAITFVALGTSLPDTFASMQAARGDKYADNSIGNVTGSNSVNVFFGLGLPWLIGAVKWAASGADESWKERFGPGSPNELPAEIYELYKETGAFIVRSGDLGLSVIVFTVCAICTIGLILIRRNMGGQELGGNKTGAMASGVFLVILWLIYIIMSCLSTYGMLG